MSEGNRIIRIHVMNDGVWVVDFKENTEDVWNEVSKYFDKKEGYSVRREYQGKPLFRIFATTLGQLIDIIQKTSEVIRETP